MPPHLPSTSANASSPDSRKATSTAGPRYAEANVTDATARIAHVDRAIKTLTTLLAQQAARECSHSEYQHKEDQP